MAFTLLISLKNISRIYFFFYILVSEKDMPDNYHMMISGLLEVADIEIYVQSILPANEDQGCVFTNPL